MILLWQKKKHQLVELTLFNAYRDINVNVSPQRVAVCVCVCVSSVPPVLVACFIPAVGSAAVGSTQGGESRELPNRIHSVPFQGV